MILPERTVDAWVATYLTGRYWRARLWAPTERQLGEGYDLAAGFGPLAPHRVAPPPPAHTRRPDPWPRKLFVLEHKGAAWDGSAPAVRLRLEQHCAHVAANALRGGSLLYYVLPNPPWRLPQAAPPGTIPDVAHYRTNRPGLPGFQRWAWVIDVGRLDDWLRTRDRAGHQTWRGETLDLRGGALQTIPGALTLRDFVSAVQRCTEGRQLEDPALSAVVVPPTRLPSDLGSWRHWTPPEDSEPPAAAVDPDRPRPPDVGGPARNVPDAPQDEDWGDDPRSRQTYVAVGPVTQE